jgi:CRISPR-associated protein Csb3
VTDFILGRSEVYLALSHLALYGLGAILEDAGHDVRLSWAGQHDPRPCLGAPDVDEEQIGAAVHAHATYHASGTSWIARDITLRGKDRGLMSPRLSVFGDDETWRQVQSARHGVLDLLAEQRRRLDLRMVAALGEPAYWSRNTDGKIQQDDGASRWEMQPRNQGSEIVRTRLRSLAAAVAAREPAAVAAGLTGVPMFGRGGRTPAPLSHTVGLTAGGEDDSALVWCALWGISQLPLAPRTSSGRRSGTARTTGHIGRSRSEWFYTPVWHQPWQPARLRTMLASVQLRTTASGGLELPEREKPTAPILDVSRRWLAARAVVGAVRFPIQRFGSDNAPERRAMRGEVVVTGGGR